MHFNLKARFYLVVFRRAGKLIPLNRSQLKISALLGIYFNILRKGTKFFHLAFSIIYLKIMRLSDCNACIQY